GPRWTNWVERTYRRSPLFVHPAVPSAVKTNEIQRCIAFHQTTGAKRTSATAQAAYGSGRMSHRRRSGDSVSHSPIDTGRAAAMYLLRSARPSHTPDASHVHSVPPCAG